MQVNKVSLVLKKKSWCSLKIGIGFDWIVSASFGWYRFQLANIRKEWLNTDKDWLGLVIKYW